MTKKPIPSVYVIFCIEKDFYTSINDDLQKRGYGKKIRSIVPTVKILRKVVHGREVYDVVPILFNYGFLRVPKDLAYTRDFMNKLKKDIPGIRSFVKHPESLHKKKKKARIDNVDIWDDFSQVAIATKKEVRRFQRMGRQNKRFSVQDILSVNIGDYIILKGYPYDGIEAVIMDINQVNKTIKLQLDLKLGKMEVNLPFDQVLDTVYSNYDPDILSVNDKELDMSRITEEAINKVLELRQF